VRYENPHGPDVVRTPVDTPDPTVAAERTEALEGAVLLLLQTLSPRERTAFVLREAFDYAYGPIAEMLQLSQAAVRQLVSRARKRLATEQRAAVSRAAQRELVTVIIAAARTGDIRSLESVLQAETATARPSASEMAGNGVEDVTFRGATVS
jgi:RNA polymerase sigma-70 factor (ECF subfamily)